MIAIRSKSELGRLQKAADVVAEALKSAFDLVMPGVATIQIDLAVRRIIKKNDARPAFLGYMGTYPAATCVSINEEVVHGIPSEKRVLKEGDIVGIDIGVEKDGYYGDAAFTIPVGEVSDKAAALLKCCKNCLDRAINKAKDGGRLGDICHEIELTASGCGFSVVRDFVGHGIGTKMHEEPQIPNYGPAGRGPRLRNGMVMALEPMVMDGGYRVKVLDDGWTVVSADGGLTCHFEHTIAIDGDKPVVLSRAWEEYVTPVLNKLG